MMVMKMNCLQMGEKILYTCTGRGAYHSSRCLEAIFSHTEAAVKARSLHRFIGRSVDFRCFFSSMRCNSDHQLLVQYVYVSIVVSGLLH